MSGNRLGLTVLPHQRRRPLRAVLRWVRTLAVFVGMLAASSVIMALSVALIRQGHPAWAFVGLMTMLGCYRICDLRWWRP